MAQTSFKAVIGPVRFSHLHVFEPHAFQEGEEMRYSAALLIPKSDKALVEQVKKAIQYAYNAAVTERWGGKKPPMDKATCLRDGDEPNSNGDNREESFHGCYFINAKNRYQPGVVDKSRQPILNSEEFYSGCWGYASIGLSGFDNNGNKGISCYLNNLMKTRDDEALGGVRTSAADDFAGVELDESEDL
jgi:hypothetical protein